MSVRFALPTALILVVLAAAGCGGGGGSSTSTGSNGTTSTSAAAEPLQPGDVLVAANVHIHKAQLAGLLQEAKASYASQGQPFPTAGTSAYTAVRSQAVTYLLQQAETKVEAGKLGLAVTDAEVEKQLESIKQSCCQGDEAKYQAALKQQGVTDQDVRENARNQLYTQKLQAKITKGITVTPAEIKAYYGQHTQEFQTGPSRAVRYILLGKDQAALASKLLAQLSGAPRSAWCTLAKKYSQDPSSSGKCGEASFTKGQTVAEFDKLLFSLPTGKAGKLNSGQYGWFVIEPTAAAEPAKTASLADATAKIKSTLLQSKQQAAITAWTTRTQKAYCKSGEIAYGKGYQPSPDPCAASSATSTSASTTTAATP